MLDRKDSYSAIPQLEKRINEISNSQEEEKLNYDAFRNDVKNELDVISGEIVNTKANILQIESSNGLIFKDGIETTNLNITIYRGTKVVSNYEQLIAQLGNTAYLRWSYLTDTGYVEISSSDSRLSNDSFTLTLSTADIAEKTTFKCELMLDGSGDSAELLAANQITIAKVLDGEQGIPGEKGADGKSSYFHIKYSAIANPTSSSQMTEEPSVYIGTYVDFTETDSTDPAKYTWSRFEGIQGEHGEQGIPGTNGADGKTSYLHIAYANSADGTDGFSVSDSTGKLYIGQYTDFVQADSTDPSKYAWTKIKGEKGADGEMSAEQLALLNQASEDASQAKSDVKNLEIGGRNLFIDSQKMAGYLGSGQTHGNLSAQNSVNKEWTSQDISCSEGDSFVLQVWRTVPKSVTSQPHWRAYQCYANDNSLVGGRPAWDSGATIDSNGIAYSVNIITIPEGASKFRFSARLYSDGFVKIEKGNKSTDWTPAPEDVEAGIANVQTGVDSLNNTVFGVQTFEYVLDGVTIPAHKREDGTYYYILNDEEVTVAEANLVHDSDGNLVSYQDGGIYESLDNMSENIEAIGTKVNSFDARETAIYNAIQDNSLIARKNARVEGNSLIITNDTATEAIANLMNYLQLNADSIVIYGNGKDIVTIAKTSDDSGYMKMNGTSMLQAQESRLSTIRLRSADGTGNLAFVAGSDGHISLREVLD